MHLHRLTTTMVHGAYTKINSLSSFRYLFFILGRSTAKQGTNVEAVGTGSTSWFYNLFGLRVTIVRKYLSSGYSFRQAVGTVNGTALFHHLASSGKYLRTSQFCIR